MKKITWDIEATNLLNSDSIDYTKVPYTLKDSYRIHCIVVIFDGKVVAFHDGDKFDFSEGKPYQIDLGEKYSYEFKDYTPVDYIHRPLEDFPKFVKWIPEDSTIIAHNQINYDLLVVKLYYGIDFKVEVGMDTPLGDDLWDGKRVNFYDSMVWSKTLNPDRFGGHSLDNLSSKGDTRKMEFRYHVPREERFLKFDADMLLYNILDVKANVEVADMLELEKAENDWNEKWNPAIKLEKQVVDLITRQEHRGFYFNMELAEKCIKELDELMEERRINIEAIIPDRPATKVFMNGFTPPKVQFKQNGEASSNMIKFAEKIGAELTEDAFIFNGKTYSLPLAAEPLITTMKATVNDTTHIKEWLVGLGWNVLEYKEKDLTVDAKKNKLSEDKLTAAIERYIEQTLNSNFCQDRMEFLELKFGNTAQNRNALNRYFAKRRERKGGIKVLTNPSFTTGQDKEICKNLKALSESSEELACITSITEYLTYRHRRNSILGGGAEWDDDEEAEKGYLSFIREDGRIPTPAGTCDAATSRMRHRVVVNVPRATSLYGENMRGLFMADSNVAWQLGYDFASLEARIEGHYCWEHEQEVNKPYCNSLIQEKPNDVHTMMSKKISDIINRPFERSPAKNVKYGCLPTDNTEVLTKNGWKSGAEIVVGDIVMGYNEKSKQNEWTQVKATYLYEDALVINFGHSNWNVEATLDHRWYGSKLKQYGNNKNCTKVMEDCVFSTEEIKQTHHILNSAPFYGGDSQVTPDEAGFVGWLLADGYYKWSEKSDVTSSSNGKKKGVIASIAQASYKFQKELIEVIEANNLRYETTVLKNDNVYPVTSYRIQSGDFREFFDRVVGGRTQKHGTDWCSWILKLNKEALSSFVHAFWLADGDSKGRENNTFLTFKQNRGNIADALILAGYLLGYNVTQRGKGKVSHIRLQKMRQYTTTQEFRTFSERFTRVFCLTTGLDTFVIRQNGIVTITGNCTYGAQAAKVAKTIGAPLEVGQMVFDAFWIAADPLAQLKQALKKEWTSFNKKRIIGIDGRLVPTRAEHAILNSLFQSGGVICAKKVMVYHDRLAAAKDMIVDFFKDTLGDKPYWQQMIAMHK